MQETTKKVLGLDLGIASIGWAVIEETANDPKSTTKILGLGSRIVPLGSTDVSDFAKGSSVSKNQERTLMRTTRKGYNRRQQRKNDLKNYLHTMGLHIPPALFALDTADLYRLRAAATHQRLTPEELGRVLYLLNQKRGYQGSRKVQEEAKKAAEKKKKESEYLGTIAANAAWVQTQTIGQYFYALLQTDPRTRLRGILFNRANYMAEYDAIMTEQQKHHPTLLTHAHVAHLRNHIIFYQRPLKSQKGLVSVCELSGRWYENKKGKMIFGGAAVAPKSSPIFQCTKIWETVHNIRITAKRNVVYEVANEDKKRIFDYLNHHENLSEAKLFELLKLDKKDGYHTNKQIKNGLQGNLTYSKLHAVLKNNPQCNALLAMQLIEQTKETTDQATGEIHTQTYIDAAVEQQPLYRLWHAMYAATTNDELLQTLQKNFAAITPTEAQALCNIDFTSGGFGNKSTKAMRHLLPYLYNGLNLHYATQAAGYTTQATDNAPINVLPLLQKNSLRQPIVEKILNQMINLVNALTTQYGKPNEIRIELARELKQSTSERQDADKRNRDNERVNGNIKKDLSEKYSEPTTRRNVERLKLHQEVNGMCVYCNKNIEITEWLNGDADVEHIIPKSKFMDDSFANKVPSHRTCNTAKSDQTAYDFMQGKSANDFETYLTTIEKWKHDKIIGKTKYTRLMTTEKDIPQDFVDRQLRETQYIAKKAKAILLQLCPNAVWATSGGVTSILRNYWGYDDVLMQLQLPKYQQMGKTEIITHTHKGQTHEKEQIIGWHKRDDHRHHAIDALVIACTKQGYITTLNTLSADDTRNQMFELTKNQPKNEKMRTAKPNVQRYFDSLRPITTDEVKQHVSNVLISYKSGKKTATQATRFIQKNGEKTAVQHHITVPRGALHEDSIYGKIKVKEYYDTPLNKNFGVEMLPYITNKQHQQALTTRLQLHQNDPVKAFENLQKNPIYTSAAHTDTITKVQLYRWVEETVMKYVVNGLEEKHLKFVVDKNIQKALQNHLKKHIDSGGKADKAFGDPVGNPVWQNEAKGIQIKTVRLFTKLKAVVPVRHNDNHEAIGFAQTGNNHHLIVYTDAAGKLHDQVVSFWHAIKRKTNGLQPIITDPTQAWDTVLQHPEKYTQTLITDLLLPPDTHTYTTHLQINDMVIMYMTHQTLHAAIQNHDYRTIAQNLYRVQSLSKVTSTDYRFRHQYETKVDSKIYSNKNGETTEEKDEMFFKDTKRLITIQSMDKFRELNPIKVRIDVLGNIHPITHL
jgi:CRISPR-associated endonuclease Csn1